MIDGPDVGGRSHADNDVADHDRTTQATRGTSCCRRFLPGRRFPFPKSLYAVEDAIRFFVEDKPNAVVLDFFAGSGTTAHAVMRLNRQDGGRRQSIMVTNNEVSAEEAKALRAQGLRPGDPEWEALGIFEHITRPRVTAAITGQTPDGEPIKGDYKFTDEFPMADGFEENAAFLELTIPRRRRRRPRPCLGRSRAAALAARRRPGTDRARDRRRRQSASVRLDGSVRRALRRGPMAQLRLGLPGDGDRRLHRHPLADHVRRHRRASCRPAWTPSACPTPTCRCSCPSAVAARCATSCATTSAMPPRRSSSASARSRRDWREDGDRTSFALSAITGSGKTVIATAVIEALFFGSTDLDIERDPSVTFLWITDDPALNRQTKARMLDASELLNNWQLREVDEAFPDASLAPGHVYFLNTQKLSKSSRLAQGGTNAREFSFWDILAQHRHRRRDGPGDGPGRGAPRHEAICRSADHRPSPHQRPARCRIRRFPSCGASPPPSSDSTKPWARSPIGSAARMSQVDIERVRASGLVKDEIGLDQPDEKGTFSTTLLREAVKTARMYEERWAQYSAAEDEPEVLPVLVVQVPDKASDAKLTEVVATIEEEWHGLGPASDRSRVRRAPGPDPGGARGRVGLPRVHPDRSRRSGRPRQGGDLHRLGLPASRGALLRAAGEGRHPHRADHRPHGPPAAGAPHRDR